MKNQWDVALGTIGGVVSYGLRNYDRVLAGMIAILTLAIIAIRVRKEWRHRND